LELAGARHVASERGATFSLAELAMQAAIDGTGVVLGRIVLAERDPLGPALQNCATAGRQLFSWFAPTARNPGTKCNASGIGCSRPASDPRLSAPRLAKSKDLSWAELRDSGWQRCACCGQAPAIPFAVAWQPARGLPGWRSQESLQKL
jgi:hypothetical protein